MIFWITLDIGLLIGWYLCSRKLPKFKTGDRVKHRHYRVDWGTHRRGTVTWIQWSSLYRCWEYRINWHDTATSSFCAWEKAQELRRDK